MQTLFTFFKKYNIIYYKLKKERKSMKVLVVVDMQNDFIDGVLGTPEAQAIVPKIVDKIKQYEGTDTLLLFTKDTHYENYLETQEGKNLPIPHCIHMTEGWQLNKQISGYANIASLYTLHTCDIINSRIQKDTFGSIKLMNILSENKSKIDEIIFVGVCTDICVISNAIMAKAAVPEALITVDAACCAGVTPERHKTALEAMKACQINIINEED